MNELAGAAAAAAAGGVALWLGIVPGAAAVRIAKPGLDRGTTLALGAALSPFLVSLVFLGGVLTGAPPRPLAATILIASIPAASLLRGWSGAPAPGARSAALLVAALPFAWVLASWWEVPGLRLFGWHNLMHLDTIYQLLREPRWPEEPELAGVSLHYAWLGFGHVAALGVLTDRAPTTLLPWVNGVSLAATLALTRAVGLRLGLAPPWALLAALLWPLSGGAMLWIATRVPALALVTLHAFSPPITKFLYLDLMPGSFALLAGVMLLVLQLGEQRDRRGLALAATFCVAGTSTYPPLVPALLALLVAFTAAAGSRPARKRMVVLLVGQALLTVAAFGLLGGGPGAAKVVAAFGPKRLALRAPGMLLAVAPLLLASLPALAAAARRRELRHLALGAMAAALCLAFVFFWVRAVEYKYLMYARLPLALLAATGIARLWGTSRGATFLAAAIAAAMAAGGLQVQIERSPKLEGAPKLDEGAFYLALTPDHPDAAWLAAVRDATPEDAILVTWRTGIHAGTFANRSLYFPAETIGNPTPGYTLSNTNNLITFRGHAKELVRRRQRVVAALAEGDARAFGPALQTLRSLGRPIVLALPADRTALAQRVRKEGGRLLYRGTRSVWLLEPSA